MKSATKPATSHSSAPSEFRLARYRFNLEAIEPLRLPPFKGSALRGGFGHTFKRIVCQQGCQQVCQSGNACPYGYIFETSPPDGTKVLRRIQNVPVPFVIEPPLTKKSDYQPGERLNFDLILVGEAIDYFPYFLVTFRELGFTGLGQTRGKYALSQVINLHPLNQDRLTVYRAAEELVQDKVLTLTWDDVQAQAATLPADRLALTFLTPTRLKQQQKWVHKGPPFQALIRILLGRISSLSNFHCRQQLALDFRGLIDRAADVDIIEADTRWIDWSRFSGRQKQRINLGGLAGSVTYKGKLADYLPFLVLGSFIHVGKGTVFGNGHYQIRDVS